MSKQSSAVVRCSHCGQTFETEVCTSVNSELNPELRQSILAGDFFKHRCTVCGYMNDLFYEVLYHDVNKKFMVWLVKPDDDNIIFMQQDSLKPATLYADYRLFIARYPLQWTERIITSELGMDPRVIELYKFGIKEKEKFPINTQNDFLYFQKYSSIFLGRTKFHWKYVDGDGKTEEYAKNVDVQKYQQCEQLVDSLQPALTASHWYLIDWQFPLGKEMTDGELIQLPETSDMIEVGASKTKLPGQFLEAVERAGKGHRV